MVRPGMQVPTPPISPQQHKPGTGDSPSFAAGLSPSGVAQSRGPAALGAHITPPGAAHVHGPPPGQQAPKQTVRSPQGQHAKTEATTSDSSNVSPLSSESQDRAQSPSIATKRSPAGNQSAADANATEASGDGKASATGSSANANGAGMFSFGHPTLIEKFKFQTNNSQCLINNKY